MRGTARYPLVASRRATRGRSNSPMKLAMIGLGRMGANMARRLMRGGHEVVAFDLDRAASAALGKEGAQPAATLADAAANMTTPRVFWVMVPAGSPTEKVVSDL